MVSMLEGQEVFAMRGRKHLIGYSFRNTSYEGDSHIMTERDYANRSLFLKDYLGCLKDPHVKVSGKRYSKKYWDYRNHRYVFLK